MKKIHLLIIDPQRDFCDPDGALSVPGADADMQRLAALVRRIGSQLWDIHCTLDTHHLFDISHPIFWSDADGAPPAPFTIITREEVEKSAWRATVPRYQAHALAYVGQLEANNRYPLCIWPPHCLIGTQGHNVVPELAAALQEWEAQHLAMVDYVTKGSNYRTEHYSAVQADVPDPSDPSTMLNQRLIQTLEDADLILLAGEALSHCLKFTVEDIADTFDAAHVRKMVLLTDCTAPVPGFEQQGADFVKAMTARGMRVTTSVDFSV